MKEGDIKTSFFHKMANAHRRTNTLVKVKINGFSLSLVGSRYKLLAEVLVNRLKKVVSKWYPNFKMPLWKVGKSLMSCL